jgi:hypothetical protein
MYDTLIIYGMHREMGNMGMASRFKQVIILVVIIAACILISMATESKQDSLSTKASVLNN